jgi:NTE family protein
VISSSEVRGTRVGLVLGGGGIRGTAWLMGALHGLVTGTGWDPATADLLIGTSAGAIVGALTAGGARPWDVLAPDRRDLLDALMLAASFQPEFSLRRLGPGSLPLALRAGRAGPAHAMKVVAGLMPKGFMSTEAIAGLIRGQTSGAWPTGTELWVVATDFATGDRVVFGREGEPQPEVATAVAASCAIPGFYRPIELDGRMYVDGGVHSGANLDLAAEAALDLVICVNPLSSPTDAQSFVWPIRALLHRQLQPGARAVAAAGSRLLLLEPRGDSIRLIGLNPMGRNRGVEIGTAASLEVQEYLSRPEIKAELRGLGEVGPSPAA